MNIVAPVRKECRTCQSPFVSDGHRVNCDKCVETYGAGLQSKARSDWSKAHRPYMRAKTRAWEARHPDMVKAQVRRQYLRHAETIKARQRAYTKTDRGRIVRAINNYKRRKRITEGDVSYDYLVELKVSTEVCVICNQKMNDIIGSPLKKSIDHIVPLCIGGKHEESNLRCICSRCNTLRPKDGSDL